jgi:hypothetical protein
MVKLKQMAILMAAMAAGAMAQPALTTIQDTLYRADGTRFNGNLVIQWNSFQAGDLSNIATAHLTLPIVNGVLSVKLVPTTTASAGAQYQVTYNNKAGMLFTQFWAVPPSTMTLRVRDVLLANGTVVGGSGSGPGAITGTPVQIGDITGLANELAIRPTEGVGFAIGRTAVINQAGMIEGAAGSAGDCVRVDGTSGSCGGNLLTNFVYADKEIPTGTLDGVNTLFTLQNQPSPTNSLSIYRNGILLSAGSDYSLSGGTVTFFLGSVPQPGDTLFASYRFADPSNPLSTLASPQVVCSSAGSSTSSATTTSLGTCTLAGGLLHTGDRIDVSFDYTHTGTTTGFTPSVTWGATTALSRTAVAAETGVSGRLSFSIGTAAQSLNSQSWGNTLAFATTVGGAAENSTINLTIAFKAAMSASTSDTVVLSNFTVTRYPAQANP